MTTAHRAALPLACALITSACGISVNGDFQGVPWTPDTAILAVADRQELLNRGGAVIPVRKNDAQQTLSVLLTAARVNVNDDWRGAPAEVLLDVKRDLATSDGLLLQGVSLDRFKNGDTMEAVFDDGVVTGDFLGLALGASRPSADAVKTHGLASKLRVTIVPKGVDAQPHGGSISADIEVQRERNAGQAGDVATGTVNLSFSSSLMPERLAESNLTVAAPILQCMQRLGPGRGAECQTQGEDALIDETGAQP